MLKAMLFFRTSIEFKQRVIEAAKKYKLDGIDGLINASMFCRIAVSKLVSEVEEDTTPKKEG